MSKTWDELHPKRRIKKKLLLDQTLKAGAVFLDDEKSIQACVKCQVPIQKTGGCNYLRCSQCLVEFCWACSLPKSICHNKSHNSHS
ncbi:MAG: RWD-domain-containing protein [Sylvanvirus sp.]|uniref:RWD-domain-containing protein n=1 Tax=Sylvanvirus sp. TaxID=2487774 RepID=A0A3G5AIG8_9VIRU|nr:MAG: RWD-domain-containing protein [Sylvanvirus sp.]